MTEAKITHRCVQKEVPRDQTVLQTSNKDGVKCTWKGFSLREGNSYVGVVLSWSFDWSELRDTGVDGLFGHITVKCPKGRLSSTVIPVGLTQTVQTVRSIIEGSDSGYLWNADFEYTFIPHRFTVETEKVSYDEMFLPSDKNDTVLLVDGKQLHVNKAFLSYHSDFFSELFSSNFKEGQMDEIPIKDISFEDLGLLMSTIYPEIVHPNDKTVEKLLKLADRFIIPAVIGHVQYHLIHNSNISDEKKTWMADQYKMPKLFEKCLREINNVEKYKKLAASPEYKKLSEPAKAEILDCLNRFL